MFTFLNIKSNYYFFLLIILSLFLWLLSSQVSYQIVHQEFDPPLIGKEVGGIAVSLNYAVIGVKGNENNFGKVYVYDYNFPNWTISVLPSPPDPDINFGSCIAISVPVIMVCSTHHIHVYLKDNDDNWNLLQSIEKQYNVSDIKLYPNNAFITEANSSVIHTLMRNSDEWVKITSVQIPNVTLDQSTLTGQSTNLAVSVPEFNQVYFYKVDNAGAKITALESPYNIVQPDDIKPGDQFGYDLDMYNGILVVSAPYQGAGSVYIYIYNGQKWEYQYKQDAPSNCTMEFGHTLITLKSYILIGCKSTTSYYLNVFNIITDQLKHLQTWEYHPESSPPLAEVSLLTGSGSAVLLATLSQDYALNSLYLGYLYCPTGRKGISCDIDIDECTENQKLCDEICINYNGGYRCACFDGTTDCLKSPPIPPPPSEGSLSTILIILGVLVFVFIIIVSVFLVFIKKDAVAANSGKFDVLPEEDGDILDDMDDIEETDEI